MSDSYPAGGGPPPSWQAGPPPGPPPGPGGYYDRTSTAKTDPMAIAGFVLALVGILLFGIILGPVGLILGILSLRRISREPHRYKGRGLAIAAIVIGAIVTLLAIVFLVAVANDPGILDT